MKYSPYIKIKMNNDAQLNAKILRTFSSRNIGSKWVLDANASWSTETARSVLEVIAAEILSKRILYVEQPFPLDFVESDW